MARVYTAVSYSVCIALGIEKMKEKRIAVLSISIISAILVSLAGATSINENHLDQNVSLSINASNITTTWNLESIFEDNQDALDELKMLKNASIELNKTYRTDFGNLTGQILLNWINDQDSFLKSLDILSTYASGKNSLNVSDESSEALLSDVQNLSTEYYKDNSFASIKLKSLPKSEWERLFREEPRLEKYRAYLQENFMRYADHSPENESHAAYIADLSNERAKIETGALKNITRKVMNAGNITLSNGLVYPVDSKSYIKLLSTDTNRNNRKKCYDQRFYHTLNLSDDMADVYSKKIWLDDLMARELKFSDCYQAKMFDSYLNESQINEMNSVLKSRKGDFDRYYEFRRAKLGLDQLMPYDLNLQLMKNPDRQLNYTDCLMEIQKSYAGMDPVFNDVFIRTVTSDSIDVFPGLEKQPGGYTMSMVALNRPALIFLNFKGLIQDEKTITHELGHAINFYLMGNSVEYLYCGGPDYESEIPSTFNEELFVDYAIQNYNSDTAMAVLAQQIDSYISYFTFNPMVAEFEHCAHVQCAKQGKMNGKELNALYTNVSKEYRSSKIKYYDQDSAEWTMVRHIFFTDNYYTFNYALSKAITLSLFKMYKENPEEFNKNYIAYLSAGTTMTPPEKLKKYFGLEINRKLFEDAMDVVKLRVNQLEDLDKGETG
ncbi:MAG TPA: peptidase [Methanotrichaceae archaeon]|nr:peptidase [Methanotrichaceae archaeon]